MEKELIYECIGEHLPHSFSKEIHDALGLYKYAIHEIPKDELDDYMEAHEFLGINVTIPYKQAVIPHLEGISDKAKSIGAVNTIVNRNGKLYGYNTDFDGMIALINHAGISLGGKKVVILGTGGTSKTANAVANHLNAREVLRVSRTANEGAITYDELYANHTDAEIIINTTPCGMFPHFEAEPVDIEKFSSLSGVVDAIYNPLRPKLILHAKARGLKATGGLYMLVAQAVRAAEIFTDTTIDSSVTDSIYNKIVAEKRNIVLIGMPSSGKSTIGKRLCTELNIPMVDTDALIVEKAGMEITEIFEKFGEAHFRDIESEVIKEVSQVNGQIISTGGGAILRNENVEALKSNGIVIFLDRPLKQLLPTSDRPLFDKIEKLTALYETRYPIYTGVADIIIQTSTIRQTVLEVIDKLNEYEN